MTTAAGADSMSLIFVDPPSRMGLGDGGWGLNEVELKDTGHVACGCRPEAIRPSLSGTEY
jgi:hypothetical protein